MHCNEIRVKQIRVNQGLGVYIKTNFGVNNVLFESKSSSILNIINTEEETCR